MFFQLPLKSKKHLIGKCTLEPNKKRCALSYPLFEEFRAWQTVNNIYCNGQQLNAKERELVVNDFLSSPDRIKMREIRQTLSKKGASYKFNFEDAETFAGCYTIAKLSQFRYNHKFWQDLSQKEQDDIWHVVQTSDSIDWTTEYAQKKWAMDATEARMIAKIALKEGYASISVKAVQLILPFLKMGYQYDVAVALAGVKKAMGEKWATVSDSKMLYDTTESIVKSGFGGGYIPVLRQFLQETYQLSDKDLRKLYHHSTETTKRSLLAEIPMTAQMDKDISNLRNPIVSKALFQVRKVVNAIIRKYGKPDSIHIEMARDLKATAKQRYESRLKQLANQRRRDNAGSTLSARGILPTYDNIQKYLLWQESEQTSLYTGKPINIEDLFNENKYQIEHIIPYSTSLDDSFGNLTICESAFNAFKNKRIPIQCYDTVEWEKVKGRAKDILTKTKDFPDRFRKFQRFTLTEYKNDDFLARHLNDTRYINVKAAEMLRLVCDDIVPLSGQLTAKLRHLWGLNTLLQREVETNDKESKNKKKERTDHRHHAIDAIVIAASTRKNINLINRWSSQNRQMTVNIDRFPFPWKEFREDAKEKIEAILVSNDQRRRIITIRQVRSEDKKTGKIYLNESVAARNALHEESVYGKRQAPKQERPAFHIRKPLTSITTPKQIADIVDDRVREIVQAYFESPEYNKNKGFFKIQDGEILPCLFMPNNNGGSPVPIFSVRMRYNYGNMAQIGGENKFVNPKNNHHVVLYKDAKGKVKDEVVQYWTAVERARQGQPIYQLPEDGREIICTLKHNEQFIFKMSKEDIIKANNEKDWKRIFEHLYKLRKITKGDYGFIHHSVSGSHIIETYKYNMEKDNVIKSLRLSPSSMNGIKVVVDVLGKSVKIIDG